MHGRAGERQEPWLLIKETRRGCAARAPSTASSTQMPDSVLSTDDRGPADRMRRRKAASDDSAAAGGDGHIGEDGRARPRRRRRAPAKARDKAPARRNGNGDSAELGEAPARSVRGRADALPAGASRPRCRRRCAAARDARRRAPSDRGWIYEIKFDGYRMLARVEGDDVAPLHAQRQRLDGASSRRWSQAVRALGIGSGWLDGEIVVHRRRPARPTSTRCRTPSTSARTDDIQYFVFDLPYCAGHDLRSVPLDRAARAARGAARRAPTRSASASARTSTPTPEEHRCRTPAACASRA